MEYLVAAYTDTGIRKETNQDSICIRRAAVSGRGEAVLAVVCDGMGGLKKGEVASATAVNAFGTWFDANLSRLPSFGGSDFAQVRRQWGGLVDELHQSLLSYAKANMTQLGTTIAAFFAYGDRYLTMNIGDSRIYERRKSLRQITEDQSLVAREIAAGRITEEESRHHPQRNILLQCLGAGDQVTPVFTEGKVQGDALYLLCTDGLSHEVSPEELEKRFQAVFLNSKETMTSALREVTELCMARGETDNITSILLKTKESELIVSKQARVNRLKKIFHIGPGETEQSFATLLETAQVTHTEEVIDLG
ncbi:MAG: serine/threonine-protein phosphatase [Lawsonibacter sp.]|jgi:serine/threonine protein phosphatase PrpC|nr:serine/threonine-protein phosphatase [Lawsonibacter sp.]